jgi:hypothetical protein
MHRAAGIFVGGGRDAKYVDQAKQQSKNPNDAHCTLHRSSGGRAFTDQAYVAIVVDLT